MDRPELKGAGGPGFDVVVAARDAIARHGLVPSEGAFVVVGVSGGPDSICLLDVLLRATEALSLRLTVAHVDHGLAEHSEAIAARVGAAAAEAGLEAHVVRASGLAGPNLQARARAFRYSFFDAIKQKTGADLIATGHTLDDRVETTIARLIHGAGTAGLAGLRPRDDDRIRPLIEVRRSRTRSYCEERSLDFIDDPANEDPRFERSSIRALVVDAIEQRWGGGGIRAIATSAARLAEDADLLAELAEHLFLQVVTYEDQAVVLDRQALAGMARGLRRRVLEKAVGRVRDRSAAIEAALDVLERPGSPAARFAVARGSEIILEADRVRVVTLTP